MGKLEGKIAVVTGGTSGIGLTTAKRFIAEGTYVFMTGRRQSELYKAFDLLGEPARGVQGDVAKLTDLDRLYDVVKAEKGHIDVVFANAAGGEIAAQCSAIDQNRAA